MGNRLKKILKGNKYEQKKFINTLTNEEIQNIEKELDNPIHYCKYHYILTENYIIKINEPYTILEYKDILLMYKKVVFTRQTKLSEFLTLITKEKKYEFLISATVLTLNYELKNFEDIIKQKNNNLLIGKDDENIQKIKDKYGIDITKW